VVVTGPGFYYAPLGPKEVAELQAAAPGVRLVAPERSRLMEELAEADGVLGPITPQMIQAARKLKWVQAGTAGVEYFLTPELKASDIVLTNCKIVQGPEIGDHALAMLLALTRELHRVIPRQSREEWTPRDYRPIELQGRTAVIIGMGGLGTQIAVRAHAFGLRVIGVDPKEIPETPFWQRCVPPDALNSVLPEADVVFVAAPATSETARMMGARQFGLMKKGSYFIVVSRGRLFDHEALVEAVRSGHLAGAGLDVTDPEPLPKGHPLWKLENVIITPHIAGRSDGEQARYMALFKENLRRFGAGLPLLNVVDKQKGY
jgi:phosphoglycerate dehydrogenase-like enzyme